MFSHHLIHHLLHQYGYSVICATVLLESMGLPLPGESMMIAAALYAATTGSLNIVWVVVLAAIGAIVGDNLGYLIGRTIGFRVLARWGRHIGLTDDRLQLGRFLFRRHGGKVVFFGRFVALLRTLAALLAGATRMDWPRFLLWNALGGIGWTCLYGFGAYALGHAVEHISGPVGIALGVAGAIAAVAAFLFIKRNETRLIAQARREMAADPRSRQPA